MEFAAAVGHHPAFQVSSQAKIPRTVDSLEIAGAMLQEPLDVVGGETVDMPVPAAAEIVLEGRFQPHVTNPDGPFGESPRYYESGWGYVLNVTAITHRRDAIYLDINNVHGEHTCLSCFPAREAQLLGLLRSAYPYVRAVRIPTRTAGMHAHISVDPRRDGEAKQILMMALGAIPRLKHAVAVNTDVDISDDEGVLWALATGSGRSRPVRHAQRERDRDGPELDTPARSMDTGRAPDPGGIRCHPSGWRAVPGACRPSQSAICRVGRRGVAGADRGGAADPLAGVRYARSTDCMQQVVIITGGGTGIGRAAARRLAAAGWQVVLTGRRSEPIDAVASEVNGRALAADMSDEQEIEQVVSRVVDEYGRLDGLVLNAGVMLPGRVGELSVEDWRRTLAIDVDRPVHPRARNVAAPFGPRGVVVAVGSIGGVVTGPASAAYGASKAALIRLVRSIAVDYGPEGVRANAVNPGWVRSEMADAEMDALGRARGVNRETAYSLITEHVPARRPAGADEAAAAIAWLMSRRPATSMVL